MTITRNPFDAGGYSLAEMTQAINILPNLYTRLGQIGLFRFEGVTQRSIVIEQREGVLSLLPSVPLGAPATVGNREARSMRSFALPWIPHDDVILPADIQGMPALGVSDAADPLVDIHELRVHGRRLTIASTGMDTVVTVDLDRGEEVGRDVLGAERTDAVTGAFVKATGRTERFHANQAFEDRGGRRWALVHHVTGLQVVQEVASRLLKRQGDGGLVSLDGLAPVDLGLSAPHSMRQVGDDWWVLDSGAGTARILDEAWGPIDTMVVGGWGRGATVLPDGSLAIGISAVRPRYRQRLQDFGDVDNHVAIIDPGTRTVVERVTVPRVDQLNAVESLPSRAIELLQAAAPPTA